MLEVLNRIIHSKKVMLGLIGMLLTIAIDMGMPDVSDVVIQGVEALFALLITIQGALDFKHGSPSDGTAGEIE
jgi:hypothetical protein